MATFGAELKEVRAGYVEVVMQFKQELTQQHGFLHPGVVATIADTACGYAALTVMPPSAGILTIEFKINLLAPATGRNFTAYGQVVRAGRTTTVAAAEVRVDDTLIATMTATIMGILDRPALRG